MDCKKILHKIQDHMLLGSVYDNIMMKTKYRDKKLSFLYNVMVAQKHRMLYYKKLKKQFFEKCTGTREWEKLEKAYNSNVIWICWLQGYDNAPLIVKRCYESVKKYAPEKEIIFLDESNIFDYVDMPEYIVKKWKEGKMGAAHFSDLLRLELLIKYGGYWMDATVLCTNGEIFKQMDDEPLFMYSFYYFGYNPEIMEVNSWFINSTTNNNVLCLTRELLYEYWKHYNRNVAYFLLHLFLTMALDFYKEEYKKMPIVSQVDAHVLATYIFDEYNQKKYEILCQQTGIHKLSTRFDAEEMKKTGTFYDVVIREGKY